MYTPLVLVSGDVVISFIVVVVVVVASGPMEEVGSAAGKVTFVVFICTVVETVVVGVVVVLEVLDVGDGVVVGSIGGGTAFGVTRSTGLPSPAMVHNELGYLLRVSECD